MTRLRQKASSSTAGTFAILFPGGVQIPLFTAVRAAVGNAESGACAAQTLRFQGVVKEIIEEHVEGSGSVKK
eukprot:gene11551-biopygen5003